MLLTKNARFFVRFAEWLSGAVCGIVGTMHEASETGEEDTQVKERILQELFGDGRAVSSPRFDGQTCTGTAGEYEVLVQLDCGDSGRDGILRISLTHRQSGLIHEPHTIPISIVPAVASGGGDEATDGPLPPEIRERTVREVGRYLDQFRKPEDRLFLRPDMVYICVPPGNGKEPNIDLARQMAQEALAAGNIPVCPCLLFLSLGDGSGVEVPSMETDAEQALIQRMVEACDRVLAGDTPWTQETWTAVRFAKKKGIPVTAGRDDSRQNERGTA